MIVVYFNQQLGAIGCFTIQTLVEICIFKAEKGRISKKFDAKYSKKCLFFKFALESWPGVLFPEKSCFQWSKNMFLPRKTCSKNIEEAYFNQLSECTEPKHCSKYTTRDEPACGYNDLIFNVPRAEIHQVMLSQFF